MKLRTWWILVCLLVALGLGSCAPPWYGETDNYPIIALSFRDSLGINNIPWANFGISRLEQLEHQRDLLIGNAFDQPLMNFDSRLNEADYLLLPLDKGDTTCTFVIHHLLGTDTIGIRYDRRVDIDVYGNWEATLRPLRYWHTCDSLYDAGSLHEERRDFYHPRIVNWIWVTL